MRKSSINYNWTKNVLYSIFMCKNTFSSSCHLPSLLFSTQGYLLFSSEAALGVHFLANTWAHSRCRYLARRDMIQSVKREENTFPALTCHLMYFGEYETQRSQSEIPYSVPPKWHFSPAWGESWILFLQRGWRHWALSHPKLATPGRGTSRLGSLRRFKLLPTKSLHSYTGRAWFGCWCPPSTLLLFSQDSKIPLSREQVQKWWWLGLGRPRCCNPLLGHCVCCIQHLTECINIQGTNA